MNCPRLGVEKSEVEKSEVEKFMVEKSGVENFRVEKSGIDLSGVEMSFNRYKDCNMDIHIVPHGCKWWHFYPSQTFEEHVEKFNQLTGNAYDLQITDIFSQKT